MTAWGWKCNKSNMEGYGFFFLSKVIISNAYSDNHISLVIFSVTPPQKNHWFKEDV